MEKKKRKHLKRRKAVDFAQNEKEYEKKHKYYDLMRKTKYVALRKSIEVRKKEELLNSDEFKGSIFERLLLDKNVNEVLVKRKYVKIY